MFKKRKDNIAILIHSAYAENKCFSGNKINKRKQETILFKYRNPLSTKNIFTNSLLT